MREALPGEVWEWCVSDGASTDHLSWEPVLLIEKRGRSEVYPKEDVYTWLALDLLTGDVEEVFNVPRFGWEKVE